MAAARLGRDHLRIDPVKRLGVFGPAEPADHLRRIGTVGRVIEQDPHAFRNRSRIARDDQPGFRPADQFARAADVADSLLSRPLTTERRDA